MDEQRKREINERLSWDPMYQREAARAYQQARERRDLVTGGFGFVGFCFLVAAVWTLFQSPARPVAVVAYVVIGLGLIAVAKRRIAKDHAVAEAIQRAQQEPG